MTVTATYSDDLSRVQLAIVGAPSIADYALVERSLDQVTWTTVRGGDTLALSPSDATVRDTFTRTAASGWGSAPTGQAWSTSGGTATDYTVNGSSGLISFGTVNVSRWATADSGVSDVDETVSVSTSAVATGASAAVWLVGRMADMSNFYAARLNFQTDGTVVMLLLKSVAGTETTLVTSASLGAYTAGVPWKVRLYVSGSQLQAKAWRSDTSEPATWTLAATDTAITTGTLIGVRGRLITGNTNTLPVLLTFDDITVTPVGQSGHLDDYEFEPGKENWYRVSYRDTGTAAGISAGTAVSGNNTSLTPPIPTGGGGPLAGDLLMIFAAIRNSGAGTVNVPAGWTAMYQSGNIALLGRRYVPGDVAPTITFSGGVANADTLAQMALWRNAELTPVIAAGQLNVSAQNVDYPPLTLPVDARCIIELLWKQDDFTGISTLPAGANMIGSVVSTAGDDAGMYWSATFVSSGSPPIPAGTFTVTGGAAAISRSALVALRTADFITRESTSITPTIDRVWIKNLARPFLNVALSNPVGLLDVGRKARVGLFDVIGKSLPVAVTDVRAGKEYTIGGRVEDDAERELMDLVLTPGDVVLIQYPPGIRLKSAYVSIGDTKFDDEAATFSLPLTEVEAPASTVVGATSLWSSVVASYATWADLIAAKPTWADVLATVGAPTDIVVG